MSDDDDDFVFDPADPNNDVGEDACDGDTSLDDVDWDAVGTMEQQMAQINAIEDDAERKEAARKYHEELNG